MLISRRVNSWIDVSNAIKDGSKDPIYVTIDAKYLSGNNKHEIAIKGIPADAETPIIILNVTNVQNGDLTVSTRLVLDYSDQTSINGVSEKTSHNLISYYGILEQMLKI